MPAPEMIKRVAMAMKKRNDDTGAEEEAIFEASWEALAGAAIAAMREPTQEMVGAGLSTLDNPSLFAKWRAMIDAALAEKETK